MGGGGGGELLSELYSILLPRISEIGGETISIHLKHSGVFAYCVTGLLLQTNRRVLPTFYSTVSLVFHSSSNECTPLSRDRQLFKSEVSFIAKEHNGCNNLTCRPPIQRDTRKFTLPTYFKTLLNKHECLVN